MIQSAVDLELAVIEKVQMDFVSESKNPNQLASHLASKLNSLSLDMNLLTLDKDYLMTFESAKNRLKA